MKKLKADEPVKPANYDNITVEMPGAFIITASGLVIDVEAHPQELRDIMDGRALRGQLQKNLTKRAETERRQAAEAERLQRESAELLAKGHSKREVARRLAKRFETSAERIRKKI